MINYIKSELLRTFKTPIYKGLLLFSLAIIVITVGVIKLTNPNFENYFLIMESFASLAILLVSSISAIIAYKTKDTKIQILSHGVRRSEMFFWDLISMQLISLITTLILAALAIISGIFVEGLGNLEPYKAFIHMVGNMIFLNINLNNAIMGLVYLSNNVSLGIISNYVLIPLLTMMFSGFATETKFEKIFNVLSEIQPYSILQKFAASESLFSNTKVIGISIIFVLIAYVATGLFAFKKREIY